MIVGNLRRGDSFALSWEEPASAGSGRSTIWLHPMVTLRFTFAGSRVPTINGAWLEQLPREGEALAAATPGDGARGVVLE